MVEADLVVVGIGSEPNAEWVIGSGIVPSNGVPCDARGRVRGTEHVHAVGDVARWQSLRFGDRVRTEHWTAAGDQAAVVAADLLGQRIPDEPLPYVWSDQFGHRIQVAGRCGPGDTVAVIRDDDAGYLAITGRDGRLASVVAVDDPKRFGAARRQLLRGQTWDEACSGAAP